MLFSLILYSCSVEPQQVQIECFQFDEWITSYCSLGNSPPGLILSLGTSLMYRISSTRVVFSLVSFLLIPPPVVFYFSIKFLMETSSIFMDIVSTFMLLASNVHLYYFLEPWVPCSISLQGCPPNYRPFYKYSYFPLNCVTWHEDIIHLSLLVFIFIVWFWISCIVITVLATSVKNHLFTHYVNQGS